MLHQMIMQQLKKPILKNTQPSVVEEKSLHLDKLQQQEIWLSSLYNKDFLSPQELNFLAQLYDQFNGNNSGITSSTFSLEERKLISTLIDWIEKIVNKHDLVIVDKDDVNNKYYLTTIFSYRKFLRLPNEDLTKEPEDTIKLRKNSLFSSKEIKTQQLVQPEVRRTNYNMSMVNLRRRSGSL